MGIESDHSETYGLDELLARARAGEGQAFCQLAAQHEARLFQQACGLIHDSSAAEDLVSETLVEAWRSLPRFNGSRRTRRPFLDCLGPAGLSGRLVLPGQGLALPLL